MRVLVFAEGNHSTRYWEASLPRMASQVEKVRFVSLRDRGEIHHNLEAAGIKTYALESKSSRDYFDRARRLSKIAREERIDVIHACEAIPAFVTGLSALWGNKSIRIFNRQHNIVYGKQRIISLLASHTSQVIMPVSKSSALAARRYDLVRNRKIHVAYSGVELPRKVLRTEIVDLKTTLGIEPEAKVIAMVARLRTEKGHKTLFAACHDIAINLEVPLHVVLAGDGQDEELIRYDASKYDNFVTHFVGRQSDVALWFSIGDVVAMPSYHEAFGLSAAEAMSCGRPLVASNVGGLAEIIQDEKNGILVPPNDSRALASQICRLINSPELMERLGANAKKRIEEDFSVDRMVDSWVQCYRVAFARFTK